MNRTKTQENQVKSALLIITVLLFASGCTPSNNMSPTNNYRTGTKGIEINFAPGSPTDVIYDGTEVPITLEIRNLGAENAGGRIYFSGFEKTILPIADVKDFPAVEGKEASQNPQGGYATLEVGTIVPKLPASSADSFSGIPIQATVCYSYSTTASLKVCIDPDPASRGIKACTPSNSPSIAGGQGGPVSVYSIKQESGKGQTVFTINIKNLGNGRVVNSDKLASCNSLGFADFDTVGIAVTAAGSPITCTRTSVRLTGATEQQKEGVLTCTMKTDAKQSPYVTFLNIKMTYGYSSYIIKNVEIRR
jgi:hypothetical protein